MPAETKRRSELGTPSSAKKSRLNDYIYDKDSIFSLDSLDFLTSGPTSIRSAHSGTVAMTGGVRVGAPKRSSRPTDSVPGRYDVKSPERPTPLSPRSMSPLPEELPPTTDPDDSKADEAYSQRKNRGDVDVTYCPTGCETECTLDRYENVSVKTISMGSNDYRKKVLISLPVEPEEAVSAPEETKKETARKEEVVEMPWGPAVNHRSMSLSAEGVAEAIRARVLSFGRTLIGTHNLPEPVDPNHPTQEAIIVVGRICCEAEGKLNSTAVVIEGPYGTRLALDLTAVPKFAIFPGQVVAVRGMNPNGNALVVTDIFDTAPLPKLLPSMRPKSPGELTVLVANGPYTTPGSMSYLPLCDLADVIREERPNVVVLTGPFADIKHSAVENSSLTFPMDDLFRRRAVEKLDSVLVECGAECVVVPALTDAFHDFAFPQPPFAEEFFGPMKAREHVTFLSNPGAFVVAGVSFVACATDVLADIGAEEIFRPSDASDRLGRLASHLIKQQSMYPLFPAPFPPPASGATPLDATKHQALRLPFTPDVMLLSSNVKCFAKKLGDAEDVLCINSGRLTRFGKGGTYSLLSVRPCASDIATGGEDGSSNGNPVADRTVVQIRKI